MKSLGLVSLFGAILSASALVFGCGGDDDDEVTPLKPSAKGESCARTSDCADPLICVSNRCVESPGSTDGGTGLTALGAEGDSCTKVADCQANLRCIQQICTASDAGATAPRLGQRGESCLVVEDCGEGLTCIPVLNASSGICDVASYGLTPTGKTCGGECKTAADCCELPINNSLGVSSCDDIVDLLGGTPATLCTAPTADNSGLCFLYQTYCTCAASTWSCTANKCVYAAACSAAGEVTGGCPALSRLGLTLPTTCSANKCQADVGCANAAACVDQVVADDTTDTCTADECTCYQNRCYRTCSTDLDCIVGYVCDATQKLCTQTACTVDTECVRSLRDPMAQCNQGTCALPCTTDHQCSGSGTIGAFNFQVCSHGFCADIGCSTDSECGVANTTQAGANLKTFCVDVAASTPLVRSAATGSS